MDTRLIILYAIYWWLQWTAANTSEDLAIKQYTAQPLQHYHQQPARSRIRCSAICKADVTNHCTGFSFNNKACSLFKEIHSSSLADVYTDSDAHEIFVFEELDTCKGVNEYEDCQAAFQDGCTNPAVYTLRPAGFHSFDAWCDFDESNGWTVIQRRLDGSVDFVERDWDDFKAGFGDLEGDLWLGNDNIHALTLTNQKLSIYLKINGADHTANYSTFSISDEGDNYRLTISGHSGDVYDAMAEKSTMSLNGMQFTTRDRDNDFYPENCAVTFPGAWWHDSCMRAHLNAGWPVQDSSGDWTVMLWLLDLVQPYQHPRACTMRITRD